jgi:hypothetical protein
MADELKSNNFAPAVFPADIMYDPNLDMSERMVLIVLYTYTNAHTNTVFPSYQTIAERAAITRRSVIRIVERLIEKGYIIKQKNFREAKTKGKIEQTSNLFTLSFRPRQRDSDGSDTESLGVVTQSHQGSDTESLGVVTQSHQGSDTESPELSRELSILELSIITDDEEKKMKSESQKIAEEIGATKEELELALKAMDRKRKTFPAAWLRKTLKDLVENRALSEELSQRASFTKKSNKQSVSLVSNTKKDKYENFYL